MKKDKQKALDNIVDKISFFDEKDVNYLTKRFVIFKNAREKKRSLFIVENIKKRQKQLFSQTLRKTKKERENTKYGKLFEMTTLLPSINLAILLQDMRDDINNVNDSSNHDIWKRMKDTNSLDTDGTIVSSFVQQKRQECFNEAQRVLYKYYPFERLDDTQNKEIIKDKRKLSLMIIKYITYTQATVDLGRYNNQLYYSWGEWYYHSYFTYEGFMKLVRKKIIHEQKFGVPNSSNLLGFNFTENTNLIRTSVKNHLALQKNTKRK